MDDFKKFLEELYKMSENVFISKDKPNFTKKDEQGIHIFVEPGADVTLEFLLQCFPDTSFSKQFREIGFQLFATKTLEENYNSLKNQSNYIIKEFIAMIDKLIKSCSLDSKTKIQVKLLKEMGKNYLELME